MAARPLAVLVLALAGTLGWAAAADAARNGPIAWAQLDGRGPTVVESDTPGGAIRDLLGPAIHPGSGVSSPTGDRFAYQDVGRDLIDRTFIAHLSGSGAGTQEELLSESRHEGFRISDWSQDGSRVLYHYEEHFGRDDVTPEHRLAYVRTPGGFSMPILLPRGIVPFAGGSFFPDSRTIAAAGTLDLLGGTGTGFLLRANSDDARDVTPIPTDLRLGDVYGVPHDPAVSPDGTKIAYSLDLTPHFRGAADDLASLVVINADGSGRHILTSGHRDTRPQWSPDGQMLTFQRQTVLTRDCGPSGYCYFEYEVFVIGADGRGEANFSNAPPYNFGPDWRPARPHAAAPVVPLVTVLMSGASLPLAPGKPLQLQVVCPKGPSGCAGVATVFGGKHDVVAKKRFLLRAGRSRVLRARVKGKRLRAKAVRTLRLVTKARHRRTVTRRVRLKRRSRLSLGCPATGRAGAPLLLRGRLHAPGKRRARILLAHFENTATGLAVDETLKTAANGAFALTTAPPTDGPWSFSLAWQGDANTFGRAAACRLVLRGPPTVRIDRPAEGTVIAADSDLALAGAAGDTVDGKLGALAWAIDGVAAGSGGAVTTRIHGLGHHVVTLTATNGAGISASQSVGIEVVRPATEPAIAISAPKDGADLPKGPTDFRASASDGYDGPLSGASIAWRDRYTPDGGPPRDDALGSGEHVTATLYAGKAGTAHTITATATNSAGTARSASVTVTAH
jgi:WD40 repeat protein